MRETSTYAAEVGNLGGLVGACGVLMNASGSNPDGASDEDDVAPLSVSTQRGVISGANVPAHYQSSWEITLRLHPELDLTSTTMNQGI